MKKAYELKLISGYPDGTFKPNNPIRSDEKDSILTKLFQILPEQFNTIPQLQVPPETTIDRAQTAAALYRAIQVVVFEES